MSDSEHELIVTADAFRLEEHHATIVALTFTLGHFEADAKDEPDSGASTLTLRIAMESALIRHTSHDPQTRAWVEHLLERKLRAGLILPISQHHQETSERMKQAIESVLIEHTSS